MSSCKNLQLFAIEAYSCFLWRGIIFLLFETILYEMASGYVHMGYSCQTSQIIKSLPDLLHNSGSWKKKDEDELEVSDGYDVYLSVVGEKRN